MRLALCDKEHSVRPRLNCFGAQLGEYLAPRIRTIIFRHTNGYRLNNAIGAGGYIASRHENASIKRIIVAANFLGEARDSKRQRDKGD
jgi:hypothetical protein